MKIFTVETYILKQARKQHAQRYFLVCRIYFSDSDLQYKLEILQHGTANTEG